MLPSYSGGRLLGRKTKVKGSKEGEVDEGCEEGRIHDGVKNDVKMSKVSGEAGAVHRLKMKKKRNAGEKGIRWQHSGMKSKRWRISWNEQGWKEAPCSWRSCKLYLSCLWMNECHKE